MKFLISEIIHNIKSKNAYLDFYSSFNKNGYYVIENSLSEDDLKKNIELIDDLIKTGSYSWKDSEDSDFRIFGYENFSKQIDSKLSDFDNLFYKHIGVSDMKYTLMANRVKAKPNNKGSGGGWHRDSLNRRQLKIMIYLNDVTSKNGPFIYLKGSHKLLNKFQTNWDNQNPRYIEKKIDNLIKNGYQKIEFTKKKGTIIIFDSSGIHRGKIIESGTRYAVTKYMFSNKIPPSISKMIS